MQPTSPLLPPRFGGFARSPGESAYPDLWRGLAAIYNPGLGVQGASLFEHSGLKRAGAITGATWAMTSRGWALDFTGGSGDLVDVGTFAVLDQITMAAWVYADSWSDSRDDRFISKANGTSASLHDWMLGKTHDGTNHVLRCRIGNNSTTNIGTASLPTGQWILAVATFRNVDSVSQLYLNGKADGAPFDHGTGTLPNNGNTIYIGNQPSAATNAPDGRIGEVGIWSRALSAQEIMALYLGASPLTLARRTAGKAPSGGTAWTLDIADTITFSDAITRSVGAVKTDALSFSDAIAKAVSASQSDAITFTDTIAKASGKAASDALSFADSSTSSSGKNIADALSFADAESNGTGKAATDALSFSDTRTASTGKSTTDTISFTDTLTIPGYVTDTITFGDSLTTSFVAGASCPPDKYLRRPLGFMTSSGERNAFAEIDTDQNKRKAIGFITNDGTGRCGFAPE